MEFSDVKAQLALDSAHIGMSGSVDVLVTLRNGKQYLKNSAGSFVPLAGGMANLLTYRQGPLGALEQFAGVKPSKAVAPVWQTSPSMFILAMRPTMHRLMSITTVCQISFPRGLDCNTVNR